MIIIIHCINECGFWGLLKRESYYSCRFFSVSLSTYSLRSIREPLHILFSMGYWTKKLVFQSGARQKLSSEIFVFVGQLDGNEITFKEREAELSSLLIISFVGKL